VRTPRRVQIEFSQRVILANPYLSGKVRIEFPEESKHPANSGADASETPTGAAREKSKMQFVPVNWLSREFASFLVDSEMEESMKPENTIQNENEARAAAPAPSTGTTGGHQRTENLTALSASREDERAGQHEKIQTRAYELFLERGSRAGGDINDWLDAEQEVQMAQSERSFRAASGGKSN